MRPIFKISAAFAALSLAACQPAGSGGSPEVTAGSKHIDPAALNFGDDPASAPQNSGVKFEPQYDVLAYAKFDPEMRLQSRVIYLRSAGTDWAAIKANIEGAAAWVRGDTPQQPETFLKESSFSDFTFNNQANIVLMFDNAGLSFGDYPVFFADKRMNGDKSEKNRSFYNAARQEVAVKGGTRAAVYLQNWYTKDDSSGKLEKIKQKDLIWYGMNVALVSNDGKTTGVQKWPFYLDPDTGNGMGGQP